MSNEPVPEGFLDHHRFRYLKVAVALIGAALLGTVLQTATGAGLWGGSLFGYVLGISAALIVLLLAGYGLRKRLRPRRPELRRTERRRRIEASAGSGERRRIDRRRVPSERSWRHGGTLQGWLSAHVYLGVALMVMVSLHSGMRFAWNLHSLTYFLLLLVVVSGLYGILAYARYPRLITDNIGGETLASLLLRVAELDELARRRALLLPDDVNAVVTEARLGTRLGGGFWQQLMAPRRDCPTTRAVDRIRALAREHIHGEQIKWMQDLYAVLLQKQVLVDRARREIAYQARMQCWLYLHVPLTLALLAALTLHVLVVLVYW